jgi:hypothetical protein
VAQLHERYDDYGDDDDYDYDYDDDDDDDDLHFARNSLRLSL